MAGFAVCDGTLSSLTVDSGAGRLPVCTVPWRLASVTTAEARESGALCPGSIVNHFFDLGDGVTRTWVSCSEPWTAGADAEVLPWEISALQGVEIGLAIMGVWAVAFGVRVMADVLQVFSWR